MEFQITPFENGTNVTMSIAYDQLKCWFYKLLFFLFGRLYCNWCLNNMLYDTKKALELQNGHSALYAK